MPNPMVGAVVVKDGVVIGEGFHSHFGGPHAEVAAFKSVQMPDQLEGSTLYVSLEPCSHFGKTPPCVDAIIQAGIRKVIVGCRDPFPAVSGHGIENLKSAGIEVIENVLEEECLRLNKRFIVAHRLKRPYVVLKWAATSDGFIAREDKSSKWISSPASRQLVHTWRAQEMAIMVGTATARLDNPLLTVRGVNGPNPVRVVIDRELKLSPTLNIFNGEAKTLIYNSIHSKVEATVTWVKLSEDAFTLQDVLSDLYSRGFISLFVEGGRSLIQSFISTDIWDEARRFVAPTTFLRGLAEPEIGMTTIDERSLDTDRLYTYEHPRLPERLGFAISNT